MSAGTFALTFTGLNPQGGDNMAFVDAVTLAFVPGSGGGGLPDNPFGYLGGLGYWQGETEATGLTYVRQRWLDTGTGSWLSVDPVASEPRYGYAGNSPTRRVDPRGTQATLGDASGGTPNPSTPIPPILRIAPRSSVSGSRPQSPTTPFLSEFWRLAQVVRRFAAAARAADERQRLSYPAWIRNTSPPSDFDIVGNLQYDWGVACGLALTLQNLNPVVAITGLVTDIYHFVLRLLDPTSMGSNPWQKFIDFASDSLAPLFTVLDSETDVDPTKRGELFGIIIGSIILLIIALIATVETVGLAAESVSYTFSSIGRTVGDLSPGARAALSELANCKFERVTLSTARGKSVASWRLVNGSKPAPELIDLARDPAFRNINLGQIEGRAFDRALEVLGGEKLPRLTKDVSFLRLQLLVVAELARIKLHGLDVEPWFLSNGIPEGVNASKVYQEIAFGHAVFTVSTTSFRPYMVLDDVFFDLPVGEQRVRLGHELGHGQQYSEILGTCVGPTAEAAAARIYSGSDLSSAQQGFFAAAKELNAQRLGLTAVFPDLSDGAIITEQMAAERGVSDALKRNIANYNQAVATYERLKNGPLPLNIRNLSFLRGLFN